MGLKKITLWALSILIIFSCCNREKDNNTVNKKYTRNNYSNTQGVYQPDMIGKQVFENLKTLNSSDMFVNIQDGNTLHSNLYMEEEERLYLELKWEAPQYGLSDWNKIEFIDFKYNNFQTNKRKYSNGYIIIKINGYREYNILTIYLLCVQTEEGYKIIEYRDDWLISSIIDYELIQDKLNKAKIEYINKFSQGKTIKMPYSLEYYKSEIIRYQDKYYGFEKVTMEISQLMYISSIDIIDNFIHGYLTFLVCWSNPKGDMYYLYTFDDNQNIYNHYYLGDFVRFENYKILMDKIPGKKIELTTIVINDYNNDGINEIALFSFYKNIGDVFLVYSFNNIEDKLEELCLIHIFIDFNNPFPAVEYTGNGFRILEVVDNENFDLAWNNYIWDNNLMKYIKR